MFIDTRDAVSNTNRRQTYAFCKRIFVDKGYTVRNCYRCETTTSLECFKY